MTVVKPLGVYISKYFRDGDKVEVLSGSDLSFYNVQVGDVFVVEGVRYPKVTIEGVSYNGDQLVLRKVTSTKKKGLCKFLERVQHEYSS
jgi:hypothetical protein